MSAEQPAAVANTLPHPGEILPVNQTDFRDYIEQNLEQVHYGGDTPDQQAEEKQDLLELQETMDIIDDTSLTPAELVQRHKDRMAAAVDGKELEAWTADEIARYNRKMDRADLLAQDAVTEPDILRLIAENWREDKERRSAEIGREKPLTADEFTEYVDRYAEEAREFPDFDDPAGNAARAETMASFQEFIRKPENAISSPTELVDIFMAQHAKGAPTTATKDVWASRTAQRSMMQWLKTSASNYPGSIREDNAYWREMNAGETLPTTTEAELGSTATEATVEKPAGARTAPDDVVARGREALEGLNISRRRRDEPATEAAPATAQPKPEYQGMDDDAIAKAQANIDDIFNRSRANQEKARQAKQPEAGQTTETDQERAWREKATELAANALTVAQRQELEALRDAQVDVARSRPDKNDDAGWARKQAALDEYKRLGTILNGAHIQSDSPDEFLGTLKHVGLPADEYTKIEQITREAFGKGRRQTSISYIVTRKPDGSFGSNMVGIAQTHD